MSVEHDSTFHSMGSDIRLLIGPPLLRDAPSPAAVAERERAYVEDFAARLSRFRPESELTALNRDPRSRVPASALLRTAVRAGTLGGAASGAASSTPRSRASSSGSATRRSLDGCEPASAARRRSRPRPRAGRPARAPLRSGSRSRSKTMLAASRARRA